MVTTIFAVYIADLNAGCVVDCRIARTIYTVEITPVVTTMKIGTMKTHFRSDDMLIQQIDGSEIVSPVPTSVLSIIVMKLSRSTIKAMAGGMKAPPHANAR
jgi:hypothetical protein